VQQYQAEIPETDGRVQALLRFLGNLNGKRVLDAGCGKGRYAGLLKRKFPQAKITALDVSAEMLAHVPAGIRKIRGGLLDLPFDASSFDAVLCVEALEHAVNIGAAVGELSRVLAPGGRLAIIDKNAEKMGALSMPHWEKWFKADEISALLREEGLEVEVKSVGYEQVTQPDGLFLCWTGIRPVSERASAEHDPGQQLAAYITTLDEPVSNPDARNNANKVASLEVT
jgi:SAM-dependent methyltransferase